MVAAASEWLRCRHSSPDPSPRRRTPARGSGVVQSLAKQGADLGRLEGVLTGRSDHLAAPWRVLTRLVGKAAKKNDGTGACSLITLPVTDGLGENAAGALNARWRAASLRSRPFDSYEPISVFDGRPLVEPRLVRTTPFPCSRLRRRYSRMRLGGVESGTSIYVRALSLCASVRVPLTDTVD